MSDDQADETGAAPGKAPVAARPALAAASDTRRAGLRALAGVTPRLTDPLLRKRGFVEGRIVRDWPLIAGADIDRLGMFPRIPAVIGRWFGG